MTDWKEIRAGFAVARGERTYLDTASYGPGPDSAVAAVGAALEAWSQGRGNWREWELAGERARRAFARLIDTEPARVALLPNCSAAAAQVAERLPVRSARGGRANLVVGDREFRSNCFPWLNQARRGLDVRLVPFRDGRLPAEDLIAAMDADTVLVAVSHVQSLNGYRVDLPRLIETCAGREARLFVDGTQSLGALRVPLDGIDFLAAAAYKWLVAPRGAAFLAVGADVEPMAPLSPGWKSPADPYANYYGGPLELAENASRYDLSLAWLPWIGAAEGLELLAGLGIDAIERRDLELAARFRAGLPALGLESLFSEAESSQIVGLHVPDPSAVSEALASRGVAAAVRGAYLRASFHFYNDEADVDAALAAIRSIGSPA